MAKPKVAIFSMACCAGCALQIVNLEEKILDLVGAVDVVEWQEGLSEKSGGNYDIAIIEGSIVTEKEAEKLRKIRQTAKIVIAIGACAHTGGINCLGNHMSVEEKKSIVYDGDAGKIDGLKVAIQPRPLSARIKVDAGVPGFPINKNELVEAVKCLLLGKKFRLPDYPVCFECALKENGCLFDLDIVCLGPITRAGCEAACPSINKEWKGCRGWGDDPNQNAAKDILGKYGLSIKDIKKRFEIFNAYKTEIMEKKNA